MQPKPCTGSELEFDNQAGVCAQRLLADADAASGIGKADRGRAAVHSPSHTTTSIESVHTQPPPLASVTKGVYTNRTPCSSPERQRHRSREGLSSLCRLPEDSSTLEFHPMPAPQDSIRRNGERADAENDWHQRSTIIGSFNQPLAAEYDNEEDEEWILDEELARQGLYRGSYRALVSLYSLTPAFTLLVFLFLAYLPSIAYPLSADVEPSNSYPYAPYLPYPIPEIFTATAFWALSHLLISPTFSFFSFILSPSSIFALCLSSLAQGTISVILRQAVIPLLLIPQYAIFDHPTWYDPVFRRVWWVALGWAAAEAVVGIKQGYEGITLYRDVLVSVKRVPSASNPTSKNNHVQMSGYGSIGHESPRNCEESQRTFPSGDVERQPLLERPSSVARSIAAQTDPRLRETIEEEVERDVDELIALRGREELEDLYGMPFIHIPVFISCLHRFNSVLFTLGSSLLLTAAYLSSTFSLMPPPRILGFLRDFSSNALQEHSPSSKSNTQLLVTLPIVLFLQWLLAVLHNPQLLPRIGIQTFVYVGFMISLGVFFAGLGVWEGVV